MRVLHLCPFYPPFVGGIEAFVSALAQAMQQRGQRHAVLTSHHAGGMGDLDEVQGVRVYRTRFMEGLERRAPRLLLDARRRACDAIRESAPDLVHLHLGGVLAFQYLTAKALHGLPLIVTVYDLAEDHADLPTVRTVLSRATRTVSISERRAEDTRRLSPETVAVQCAVPVSLPAQEVPVDVSRDETPLFLMSGRQVYKKGFDIALQAFAAITDAHPDARLIFTGGGPERDTLRELIATLGLERRVELPGIVSSAELTTLFHRAWICLVPSRHSESFGLVALQAMQSGAVVIASRRGGLREVVQDGQTGLLVPPDDADALASAMETLLADPARREAMADAARTRAGETFGWQRCVERYATLYQEAVS